MAEYVELYKKYKPRIWDDLIGQDRVRESLRTAIIEDKIPVAYGFFGARGTGKTSAALLFAKGVNCPNTSNGDPCNSCDVCHNIDNDSQLGVNYISMANNGSVEDIRRITNEALLRQPIKRPIWILDEVHNLSKAAFDALLVPIEKNLPATFIMCSTDSDKIPDTIMSRIHTRKFSLVSPKRIAEHLSFIAKKESLFGLDSSDTKRVIVEAIRRGKGSIRDSLTALEDIVNLGSTESDELIDGLIDAISRKDTLSALEVIAHNEDSVEDYETVVEDLVTELRNLALISHSPNRSVPGVLVATKNRNEVIARMNGSEGIIPVIDMMGDALKDIVYGLDPKISLELAVIKSING